MISFTLNPMQYPVYMIPNFVSIEIPRRYVGGS